MQVRIFEPYLQFSLFRFTLIHTSSNIEKCIPSGNPLRRLGINDRILLKRDMTKFSNSASPGRDGDEPAPVSPPKAESGDEPAPVSPPTAESGDEPPPSPGNPPANPVTVSNPGIAPKGPFDNPGNFKRPSKRGPRIGILDIRLSMVLNKINTNQ